MKNVGEELRSVGIGDTVLYYDNPSGNPMPFTVCIVTDGKILSGSVLDHANGWRRVYSIKYGPDRPNCWGFRQSDNLFAGK